MTSSHTFNKLLQTLPHDMNVLDANKLVGNIIVEPRVLVTLACSFVSHGIELEEKIQYVKLPYTMS